MKRFFQPAALVLAGAILGLGASRLSSPLVALAQTASPAPPAMPMQGGMMTQDGSAANCPAMATMMQRAHAPADRQMMSAMMTMHRSMANMQFTGNTDRDFMTMMVPHHEAAIGMAKAEIQYGKDPRVIALAKNIITAQQKEINEMESWLK